MPIYKLNGSKNGKQRYRVRVNYTDRNGKAHQIERITYGMTEAKRLERALADDYKASDQSTPRMTVRDLYREYMAAKEHEVRRSTYDKTMRTFDHHILPQLGDLRIDRLSAISLQRWKNDIAGRGLSIVTQRHIYAEFHTMLNYAVRMEYLHRNPLQTVGNFKSPDFVTPQDKLHYYTPEQFLQYIAMAKRDAEAKNSLTDWGYYVFFMIAFYTGMRKGEINALKWSDIEGNILLVRRSVCQKLKGVGLVETPPKNRTSYRSLTIPRPLMDALEEHRARYRQNGIYSDDLRVCGGIECLSDSSLSNRNSHFAAEAGLPHIRIHDFRHSHASLLANEGINIQEIAQRLGHAKIEQTWNTYSHLYPREEERAVAILDRIK